MGILTTESPGTSISYEFANSSISYANIARVARLVTSSTKSQKFNEVAWSRIHGHCPRDQKFKEVMVAGLGCSHECRLTVTVAFLGGCPGVEQHLSTCDVAFTSSPDQCGVAVVVSGINVGLSVQ